jgi:hypothetical protein
LPTLCDPIWSRWHEPHRELVYFERAGWHYLGLVGNVFPILSIGVLVDGRSLVGNFLRPILRHRPFDKAEDVSTGPNWSGHYPRQKAKEVDEAFFSEVQESPCDFDKVLLCSPCLPST